MHQASEHIANQTAPEPLSEEDVTTEDEARQYLSEYWALEQDGEKLWATLQDKERECFDAYNRRGFFSMARLSYNTYFGTTNNSGVNGMWQSQSLSFGGENGELIEFTVNEYRSFADQIVNMACKSRPAFQAQATNSDYASLAQINSSDNVVSYFYEDSYGERKEREVVKLELMYGKAYTHVTWDEDAGEMVETTEQIDTPYGPSTQKKMVRSGKLRIDRCFPWDVVQEPYRSEHDEHLWRMIISAKRSKVEMQARFPLYAKQIQESNLVPNFYEYSIPGNDPLQQEAEGLCSVRIFYHLKTMAVPNGRKVVFVNDVMVDDDELPIDSLPIIPFFSCELHGTSFGISDLWNLIPIDQIQNQVLSDVATNLEAFGRPSLALVEGSDVDIDALANGQKIVFVPPGKENKPEPIKFPEIPAFSLKAVELFRQLRQSLSGLNAIARGDTSTNITSGAHAALYSQIAIEAQSDRALALDLHRERVANTILSYLKKYAKHPQLVAIAGIDERPYLDYFQSDDFAGIKRVKVKTANPLQRNQAGRIQLIELLKNFPGMPLKDPQQIVEFITSGQFKPMVNTTRTSQLRIRWENERLLDGPEATQVPGPVDPMTGMPTTKNTIPSVPVLATDNAASHVFGHLEVLNSPAAMNDPKISGAVLTHILEHIDTARNGDPYLAQLLGNPPPQQMVAPGEPQPGQEAAKGGPSESVAKKASETMTPPDEADDSVSKLPTPAEAPPGSDPQAVA